MRRQKMTPGGPILFKRKLIGSRIASVDNVEKRIKRLIT